MNDVLAGLFAVLFLPAAHVAVAQTSPSVTSITPVSNVLNVAADSNIIVMFDQAILPATSDPSPSAILPPEAGSCVVVART